jgi:hypothetical protein
MNIELAGAPEDVQYFGWALQHLPEANMLSGLLAVPGALPPEVAVASVQNVYQLYLYRKAQVPFPSSQWRRYRGRGVQLPGGAPFYTDIVSFGEVEIEDAPNELYDADRHLPGIIDDSAYQAMLAGFLGAFDRDTTAVRWLATLLLRGTLNRQLVIGSFIRMLTRGELGAFESVLPTKSEVVSLATTLVRGDLPIEYELAQVIRNYADYISPPSDPGSGSSRRRSGPSRRRSGPSGGGPASAPSAE